MAKPGSIFCACRNASIASSYSKLWRKRTPRTKRGCACAEPDVGKEMRPSGVAEGVCELTETTENTERNKPQRHKDTKKNNFLCVFVSPWLMRDRLNKNATKTPRHKETN